MTFTEINNDIDKIHVLIKNLYNEIFTAKEAPRKNFLDSPEGELTQDQYKDFSKKKIN